MSNSQPPFALPDDVVDAWIEPNVAGATDGDGVYLNVGLLGPRVPGTPTPEARTE